MTKSTFAAKEIEPLLLVFLKIETEYELVYPITMSKSPSPSISPTLMFFGELLVDRLALAEVPKSLFEFLKMLRVLLLELVITRSGLPSPLKSAVAIPLGYEELFKG